jgi:hypothetical protein
VRKRKIKLLNNKYIIAYYIKINKETKVFYVPPKMCSRTPGGMRTNIPVVVVFSLQPSEMLVEMQFHRARWLRR